MPYFPQNLTELNNRSLDNCTIYFLTSESWTWTPKVETLHPPTNKFSPKLTHFRHSNTNATSRPNVRSTPSFYPANKTMNIRQPLANRQIDTYFPRQSHWQPQQDYHDTEQRNQSNYWSATGSNTKPIQQPRNYPSSNPNLGPNHGTLTNSSNPENNSITTNA